MPMNDDAPSEAQRFTILVTDAQLARILRALEHTRSSRRCEMFEAKRSGDEGRAAYFEQETLADQAVWDALVEGFSKDAHKQAAEEGTD